MALTSLSNTSLAQTQNVDWECATWLCLPGGFPSGCENSLDAMKKRLRKGKSPLPPLSSCGGGSVSSNYTTGVEYWFPCGDGYKLHINEYSDKGLCVTTRTDCEDEYGWGVKDPQSCLSKAARRRKEYRYVDVTVDNKHHGKYFY